MNICRKTTLTCVVFFVLVMPARAVEIYRYVMPDGTMLYTNEVSTKGKFQEVIESPPPDSKQIVKEERAKFKREEARANRIASQHESSLDAVEVKIHDATRALTAAKAALAAGVVLQPEDRIGIVDGSSRFSSAYWVRQRELQEAVDDAREQLDDAYSARDALK